jgi:GntR family transcriptional repressor for pyruvate dehydrogenase complex
VRDVKGLEKMSTGTMADRVAHSLLEYLLRSDQVKIGDRLPSERELADAFGVGRSAVREALKALSFLGLLEIRPGSGTFLLSPESNLLPQVIEWGLLIGESHTRDLVELRALLEIGIAGIAATRRDDEDLTALETYIEIMKTSDGDTFVDADIAFHLRLAQATNNSTISDLHSNIQALLRVWMTRVVTARGPKDMSQQHEAVLEAVQRGDPAAAQSAMQSHMQSAREQLFETLENQDEPEAHTRLVRHVPARTR